MPLIQTTTAEGALKGMILARAPHELTDQEAAYLQDIVVNQPGLVTRRGAIQGAISLGANLQNQRPAGVVSCYDPQGNLRIMVLHWLFDTTAGLRGWGLWGTTYDSSWTFRGRGFVGGFSDMYPRNDFSAIKPIVLSATPCTDGSVIIGYATTYGKDAIAGCCRWYGAAPTGTTTHINWMTNFAGTPQMTFSSTMGSAIITGTTTEIAKLSPGIVLVDFGVVKSIDTTTQATLTQPAHMTVAGRSNVYLMTGSIGVVRTRGKINVAAGTKQVIGFGTRFQGAVPYMSNTTTSPGIWLIDPMQGDVIITSSTSASPPIAPSDTLINGDTNANKSAAMGAYILRNMGTQGSPGWLPFSLNRHVPSMQYGYLSTTFKGYQLYFNAPPSYYAGFGDNPATPIPTTNRCHIAGPNRPDEFDHSADDGDFFDVTSTAQNDQDGIAVMSGRDAAVFCKSRETFALVGDSPDDFQLTKIADDGALTCEAITRYKGDVIWMGKTGIWRFDGQSAPVNIIENTMGDRWQVLLSAFNGQSQTMDANGDPLNQARCFIYRDHLFVNITNTNSQHVVYTDGVARVSNPMQLCIYLPTNAMSFISNFNFAGYLPGFPPSYQHDGFALLPQNGSTTHYAYPMSNFFAQGVTTVDAITTVNPPATPGTPGNPGPWFHIESRKYDVGDGLLRKAWKQLATEMKMTNTKRVFLETVAGLNVTGVRQVTPFTGNGNFLASKVKFNVRDQYISYRMYEDYNNRPSTLQVGVWQWAYKVARRGAV